MKTRSVAIHLYRFMAYILAIAWNCDATVGTRAVGQQLDPLASAREVQSLELLPHRTGGWIFPLSNPPHLVWRDAAMASHLGMQSPPQVRWFDQSLSESKQPDHPGRWMAWVEGTAPNGLPLRRSFTFFALPEKIDPVGAPDLSIRFPNFPAEDTPPLLREFQSEIERGAKEMFARAILDSERGAILLSALYESEPLHRPRRFTESSQAINAEKHLALKIKLGDRMNRVRLLEMPRRVGDLDSAENATDAQNPADRDFSSAKAKIDDFCREWATATGEPFVTMIVSDGQVVTHEAFGATKDGQPIDRDYRCWIASITKTVTGIMFARFIDQNLIGLDDSLASVFPDYPKNNPHVPTFRQCLNHTAGFEGHGDFGGVNNPHFENLILNAIEINEPGKVHRYSGTGFELTAKAMEIASGLPAPRLYEQQLFQPLGCGDVTLGNASSDAEMTAAELSALGQLLLGRGTYRGHQFFRPDTFDQLLPQSLSATDAPSHGYGVGLHWIRHRRPSTEPKGQQDGELLFSNNTIGHGSFSGCILVIDLDRKLVITQARREFREQDNPWFQRYFAVVADALKP